jgi:transposase
VLRQYLALSPLRIVAQRTRSVLPGTAQLGRERHLALEHDPFGVGAFLCSGGVTTREVFETYLDRVLAPALSPGQVVVMDNLSRHTAAAFYETFAPQVARRLARRVEFVYTPVHGSWLNMVEVELSVLVRQCLGKRRLPDIETLRREVGAWAEERNRLGASVEWRFTTSDARTKLRKLYPSIEP